MSKDMFTIETEKLVRWYNKGLITKKESIRRFKILIDNRDGRFNKDQWERDKAANRVLKDRLNRNYKGFWE